MIEISEETLSAIHKELNYQAQKYGVNKEQSLPGFLIIMQKELDEAIDAWNNNDTRDRQTPLEEVTQVVTTGIACLNKYGTKGSAVATDDIPKSVQELRL